MNSTCSYPIETMPSYNLRPPPRRALAPTAAPPLYVAVELPPDLVRRVRRLGHHLGIEDVEELIRHVLRHVCDRLEARGGE
jgi:hypothetical protein